MSYNYVDYILYIHMCILYITYYTYILCLYTHAAMYNLSYLCVCTCTHTHHLWVEVTYVTLSCWRILISYSFNQNLIFMFWICLPQANNWKCNKKILSTLFKRCFIFYEIIKVILKPFMKMFPWFLNEVSFRASMTS